MGTYPDRDGFAEIWELWPGGRLFSVESYEQTETGYQAVLVDLNTSARVKLQPIAR